MNESFTLYTVLLLLGCLLAGIGFSWLLYRGSVHLEKWLRYSLAAGRAVVITLIGFLLFFPLIRNVSYNLEKPIIVIAQDNSLSVGAITTKDFDKSKYEQDFKKLSDQLLGQYEVKIYSFSDRVNNGFDFKNQGKISNASGFINQLNDELVNRNVGAVILASDGIFNRGGSPMLGFNKLKAPVYTIGLGDTVPKKDLMIANVNHNSLVYLDNEFTIEAQVQAFEGDGETSTITVSENGKLIYRENIRITSSAFAKTIPIKLKAAKIGLQKYTVSLKPIANEISERNNVQQIFIDIIDAHQKVLLAGVAPHPDVATLKQAITMNKHYDLKVVTLSDDLNALNPADFGLIILYQLPSLHNEAISFLSKVKQTTVPIWYILGAQSNLSAFNQFQSSVNFTGNNQTLQEAYPVMNPGFSAFTIDAEAARAIEGLDPLQAPFGQLSASGDALVVLKQRIGKIKTEVPQLFFIHENGRKSAYLVGEGLWRWKLSSGLQENSSSAVNTLISNTIQYLSAKDDKRKFKAYSAKRTFDENEHVLINAVLYNDNYVAVNTPDVSIQVKNSEGKTYSFLFSKTESAYQLDAGALPAGNYTYTASTTLGSKKYTAVGVFYVNALLAEYQQTTANHQLLNAISAETNGKLYMPQDLLKIAAEITANDSIKTLSYEDRKYEEMINFKWLFILIMALLTMEWFFRKRNGEI